MYSKPHSGLEIFSELKKSQLLQINRIFDESIIKDPLNNDKIQELKNLGFTKKQSMAILEAFFNFYDALKHSEQMKNFIEQLEINDNTKRLIMDAFEMVLKKGDKSKVILIDKAEQLKIFGHDHLRKLDAVAEFRPLTDDGKLQKVVVSIVLDGEIQNTNHVNPKTINFQTDFATFQTMVRDLNTKLNTMRIEINTLKKKMGDDIVEL